MSGPRNIAHQKENWTNELNRYRKRINQLGLTQEKQSNFTHILEQIERTIIRVDLCGDQIDLSQHALAYSEIQSRFNLLTPMLEREEWLAQANACSQRIDALAGVKDSLIASHAQLKQQILIYGMNNNPKENEERAAKIKALFSQLTANLELREKVEESRKANEAADKEQISKDLAAEKKAVESAPAIVFVQPSSLFSCFSFFRTCSELEPSPIRHTPIKANNNVMKLA